MRLRQIFVVLALICVVFVLTTEAKGKWKKKKYQKMMAKKAAGKGHHNDIGDLNKKQMKKMMKRIKKMKMARMEKEGVEGYNPKWMKKVSPKKHIAWLKLKSDADCGMKCEQGEVCIVGPMDAKPLCVRKKSLKKSMKLFHKYQKKEKKAWKKFKLTHYNKEEEDDDAYFSKFTPKELGDTSEVEMKTDMAVVEEKPHHSAHDKAAFCTPIQFSQMRKRMMGWFHLLHGQDHLAMGKKVNLKTFHKSHSVKKETRQLNGTKCNCAKSAMWQFHKVDKVADDMLTHDELSIMYQNDAEPCLKPFFTSCDLNGDEQLSADEWCCCFSNIVAPCFSRRSEKSSADLAAQYTPRCDKEGYYKAEQCMVEKNGTYKCWCVDYNGNEYKDSVTKGRPHCKKQQHRGYEEKPEV